MSARKAARRDLAITDLHTRWTPTPGDRVRRDDQTTKAATLYGTADVLGVSRDGHLVTVSRDPGPYGEPRWVRWPTSRVRRVTAARANHTSTTTISTHLDRTDDR